MGLFDLFRTPKNQFDFKGQKKMRFTESPVYKPTFEGQGGVFDAIKRQNTGYDPKVMSDQESVWSQLAKRQFGESEAKIGQQTSAGGLGRSSLRGAQSDYANQGLAMELANRSAQMRLANEANISQQQMQGRGLGVTGAQADVASQHAASDQEYQTALQQFAVQQQREQARNEGWDQLGQIGIGAATAAFGGLPGVDAGALGALQGGIAGLSGDYGMFQPKAGLFSGATFNTGGDAGKVNIGGQEISQEELAYLKQILQG